MKRIVVQGDGAEGKLHGSTRYPLIDRCTDGRVEKHSPGKTKTHGFMQKRCRRARPTFVFRVDIIADVQVQVFDLEVMRGLAYVVGTEQPGHGGAGVSRCGRLLGSDLLR